VYIHQPTNTYLKKANMKIHQMNDFRVGRLLNKEWTMKNLVKIGVAIYATLMVCSYSMAAFAANNASSTVTGNIPVLNTVQSNGGSISVSVDPTNGQLSGNISTGFSVFTNNSRGVNVQFDVTTATTTGSVNASTGTAANSNTGKVVITNSTVLPAATSVTNALLSSASLASNPNAVAYKIQFTGSRANTNPVYSTASSTSASALAPVGMTTFTAQILTDNTYLTNTYDDESDYAGAYQATVNCTISTP